MNIGLEPIRYEIGRPMLLGGLRRRHAFADEGRDIPAQWTQFVALGAIPGRFGDSTYGVMCGADAEGFEYMCATEVESLVRLPPDMGRIHIREQTYAVFHHSEHVSTIRETWVRVYAWLAKSRWSSAQRPDFEVYDSRYDRTTGLGGVEIRIAVVNGR